MNEYFPSKEPVFCLVGSQNAGMCHFTRGHWEVTSKWLEDSLPRSKPGRRGRTTRGERRDSTEGLQASMCGAW